ncbi:MAG: GTPase [Chloroflexota bacterium]
MIPFNPPAMPTLNDILHKLPPETRDIFRIIWESLTPADRSTLQALLGGLPPDANLLRLLMRLSANQLRAAFGQKSRVAILGPANVGKSTLYNQFIQQKNDRAEVSPLPGTTRANQSADTGLFSVVDTPGADAVGEVGERERQEALSAAEAADFLIIVFDAIQGIKQTELDLYQRLTALNKPYIVVLNKIDLVRKQSTAVIARAALNLGLNAEQVLPVAAKSGEGIPQILAAIAALQPEITAALGRGLPQYRWQLAWRSIVSAASVAAVIALTPLPLIDFAPLIVTQSVMVLGIARLYQYRLTLERARELAAAFGLGLLARTLFAELSKLGGLPGWLLAAAIAASTTVVMGYAAVIWFERGEKLSAATLQNLTQSLTALFLEALKGLGKRKPAHTSLQQRINEVLSKSPLGEDRSLLDDHVQDQSSTIHQ